VFYSPTSHEDEWLEITTSTRQLYSGGRYWILVRAGAISQPPGWRSQKLGPGIRALSAGPVRFPREDRTPVPSHPERVTQ
jgi:hypothetical protein